MKIYIDADYSISAPAAEAIELGAQAALKQVGFRLGGLRVSLVRKDHRANVKRTKRTLEQFLETEDAIAILGGMHSPPYLAHKDFINRNGILTLLPWSAAGPITRATPGTENWIFRLSVDDSKSGEFFVQRTIDTKICSRLALILLETGWGRANHRSLTEALSKRGQSPVEVVFFPSSIGSASAKTLAEKISNSGADCAVMLANWNDGSTLTNALHQANPKLLMFSHWGIMGGEFASHVPPATRKDMQIEVLQTCGLRRENEASPTLRQALAQVETQPSSLTDLPAPTGFVHGYDLTRILIAAAAQASSDTAWQTGSMADRRRLLHDALENLKAPVSGILSTYETPFSDYSAATPDAHEALGITDLCMARFRDDGLLEDVR